MGSFIFNNFLNGQTEAKNKLCHTPCFEVWNCIKAVPSQSQRHKYKHRILYRNKAKSHGSCPCRFCSFKATLNSGASGCIQTSGYFSPQLCSKQNQRHWMKLRLLNVLMRGGPLKKLHSNFPLECLQKWKGTPAFITSKTTNFKNNITGFLSRLYITVRCSAASMHCYLIASYH